MNLQCENCRTRIQRLVDAKFLNGWISRWEDGVFAVSMSLDAAIEPGESFFFHVYAPDKDLHFYGRLLHVEYGEAGRCASFGTGRSASYCADLVFEMTSPIRDLPQGSKPRFAVSGLCGTVTMRGSECEVSFLDVSEDGLGFLACRTFDPGDVVELCIATLRGVLECKGEVRYSVSEKNWPGYNRTGVKLHPMDRVNAAKWRSVFDFRKTGLAVAKVA
jgi:hypothetical protein